MDPITPPAWMPAGVPRWNSQPILGDPDRFGSAIFSGTAAQLDSFLGNPPATTAHGPCTPNGGAIAITGALTGETTADVAAAGSTLAALAASGPARLIANTGIAGLPHRGWDCWEGCWFAPTDLTFDAGGIVAAASGGYELPYRLIVRGAKLLDSGAAPTPATVVPGFIAPFEGHDASNPHIP